MNTRSGSPPCLPFPLLRKSAHLCLGHSLFQWGIHLLPNERRIRIKKRTNSVKVFQPGHMETQRTIPAQPVTTFSTSLLKIILGMDFPDGPLVKNPPANAGDTGSIFGPSLVWKDSTYLRATGPVHRNYRSTHALEPMLLNKRSHCNEKPMHHN